REERMDQLCARRNAEQSQCDRGAGAGVLEWDAAGAGSFGRKRVRRAERSTAAFWAGQGIESGEGGDSVAVRAEADVDGAGGQQDSFDQGAGVMSVQAQNCATPRANTGAKRKWWDPYLPPAFITLILLVGNWHFGI